MFKGLTLLLAVVLTCVLLAWWRRPEGLAKPEPKWQAASAAHGERVPPQEPPDPKPAQVLCEADVAFVCACRVTVA